MIRFEPYDITAAKQPGFETIAVDLDKTLAVHTKSEEKTGAIGPPIPRMVNRVRRWLAQGHKVVIFTARLGMGDRKKITRQIEAWCKKYIGVVLPVTDRKSADFTEIWDDRTQQVIPNTGVSVTEALYKR